jgi:MFS family permease
MNNARRAALLGPVLVMTVMVGSIVSSLGAPLIPTVAKDFHDSLSAAQWSLTVALLSGAVSAPVMGRLGDGPRRKATLIGAMAVVTFGCMIAAVASSLDVLIIGRALQGVGLGLVPLAMATARDELPKHRIAPMIALLSVSGAAAAGAGFPISGLIADAAGLSGAFWFGAAVCGVTTICLVAVVPSNTQRAHAVRLDSTGAVLLAATLTVVLVAVAQGASWGWGSPEIIGLLLMGVALFAAWALQQLHTRTPLVQLSLLRHPAVLAGNVCALVLSVAMYMNLSAMTEFVQLPHSTGFGFAASVVMAGLILVPLSILMLAGSRLLPTLVRHLGVRAVLALGCLVVALSSGFFVVFHRSFWDAFVTMGVLGIGLGATFAAIPGLIVQSVPTQETGSAMGFYQVVRYVGFSLGSALTASILASHSSDPTDRPTLTEYTTVFWVASAICVAAAVLAWILPGNEGSPGATPRRRAGPLAGTERQRPPHRRSRLIRLRAPDGERRRTGGRPW